MESLNIVFTEKNKVELLKQQVPDPGPGEVLCRAEMSLISIGTEARCLRATMDPKTNWASWVKYPFNPGYSMAATVVKVGSGVEGFKAGDRVAAFKPHSQYFIDSQSDKFFQKIPSNISFAEAAWMAIGGCITQTSVRRADLRLGDNVGIIGLGMLGQLVTQYIHLMGAGKIIAIDTSKKRLEMAMQHGATHALDMDVKDAMEDVREITDGRMLDIVYDITGLPHVLSSATTLVRKMGKIMMTGDNTTPSQQYIGPNFLSDSLSIIATHGDNGLDERYWDKRRMSSFFFEMLASRRMDVKSLNTGFYSPREAKDVYRWLLDDRPDTVGVLFDWNKL